MSLDTSLRTAERAGDWRAQVVHLRRAGRYLEAIDVLKREDARLDQHHEALCRATVRPVAEKRMELRQAQREIAAEIGRLMDEHRLASSWTVRCPSCDYTCRTSAEDPACDPCAREGRWVRMERVQ